MILEILTLFSFKNQVDKTSILKVLFSIRDIITVSLGDQLPLKFINISYVKGY